MKGRPRLYSGRYAPQTSAKAKPQEDLWLFIRNQFSNEGQEGEETNHGRLYLLKVRQLITEIINRLHCMKIYRSGHSLGVYVIVPLYQQLLSQDITLLYFQAKPVGLQQFNKVEHDYFARFHESIHFAVIYSYSGTGNKPEGQVFWDEHLLLKMFSVYK